MVAAAGPPAHPGADVVTDVALGYYHPQPHSPGRLPPTRVIAITCHHRVQQVNPWWSHCLWGTVERKVSAERRR